MYERFTDRARKVMNLANQEAIRLNHEYLGTEHILYGLAREGSGVACNVLKNLGVAPEKVRHEIERLVVPSPAGTVSMDKLPNTPRAKDAIQFAIDEAKALQHNYVGTEHLLLGVLRVAEGIAAQVLANLNIQVEDVRNGVLELLGHRKEKVLDDLPPFPSVGPAFLEMATHFACSYIEAQPSASPEEVARFAAALAQRLLDEQVKRSSGVARWAATIQTHGDEKQEDLAQ